MQYCERIIRESVERFETQYTKDYDNYSRPLHEMNKIELESITEQDTTKVVRPFLYKWGMGRVLGQISACDWERNLTRSIQSNAKLMESFRASYLENVDLHSVESGVIDCYESFKSAVGKIAAAKTLHLICPNFFALWDNPIANGFHQSNGINVEQFSGKDYYAFLQFVQTLMTSYGMLLSELAVQYKKGKLKIVDEFLWWSAWRPFSIFLPK